MRSWRTNFQINVNGSYPNNILSTNRSTGSSSATSSSVIGSLMSTQSNHRREACVLVCTSIEHPKAHCPPKLGMCSYYNKNSVTYLYVLVRAVTLASRYLIQSNG